MAMTKNPMIFKFNENTKYSLEDALASKAGQLRTKIDKGESLTQEEMNWLTNECSSNTFSKKGIPIGGYLIYFFDILKPFAVEYDNHLSKVFAPNKESVFNFIEETYDIDENQSDYEPFDVYSLTLLERA